MAQSESTLNAVFTDTANAIRSKKGTVAKISPVDFADEIASIQTGITPTGTINISTNGTHNVTNYASASVNVQPQYDIYYITSNNVYDVSNYRRVSVEVDNGPQVTDGWESLFIFNTYEGELNIIFNQAGSVSGDEIYFGYESELNCSLWYDSIEIYIDLSHAATQALFGDNFTFENADNFINGSSFSGDLQDVYGTVYIYTNDGYKIFEREKRDCIHTGGAS